jgi:predicted MFS family arabinose efflux permease
MDINSSTTAVVASASYRGYVLTLLFLLYVLNFVDRQILSILVEPIKQELGVSDTAMGFLTGVAFAIFYTFAGIPIARLADRGSRVGIITVGLTLWSALTALSGVVRSFSQLALARVGVGVGEAAFVPPAHSLISDYFPPRRRATALAVFSMGIYVGIACGFVLGGWLAQRFGWRSAFFAVGLPGLVAALVLRLTVREPPRGVVEGTADREGTLSTAQAFALLRRLPSFWHVILGAAFHSLGGYAFAAWSPAFYLRLHGTPIGRLGVVLGLIIGLGGALGAVAGGYLADRLTRRDIRWQVWVPALASLAAIPFLTVLLFAPGEGGSFTALAPFAMLSAVWSGPVFAATQGLATLRTRALASALLAFCVNLIGLGLGPQLVGILNDLLAGRWGPEAVRYSLLLIIPGNLWAITHFLLAARTLGDDYRAKKA